MAEQVQDSECINPKNTFSVTRWPWCTAPCSWLSRNFCSAICNLEKGGSELLRKVLPSSLIRRIHLLQGYIIPFTIGNVDMSQFNYPFLDPKIHDIRLLYLLPGPRGAQISCKLAAVSLKDRPDYEALSYVWGDASHRRNILLDGYTYSVTENLEGALKHLRRYDKKRVLWVDALCINQGDKEEKKQQIQKMRHIYHSAQQVLAWTGEADESSDEALELLKHLSEPTVFMTLYELASKPDAYSTMNFNRKWQTLFRFLNRPYWSRVWIVQELAIPGMSIYDDIASRKVQVGVGWTWIPLSSFNLGLSSLGQIERSLLSSPGYLFQPRSIDQRTSAASLMFEVVQSCIRTPATQQHSIDTLLRRTFFLRSTDPRDRVYALIALARNTDHVLVPDYSISTTQMLREMVRHLLVVDQSLAVLSGNRRLRLNYNEEWSSWTPDPERYIHTSRSDWQPETTPFKACTSIAPAVTFSDDLSLLTVKGIVVDKISTIIGPVNLKTFPGLGSNELSQSTMMRCLQQLEQFGSTLSKSKRELLWRTLVLDSEELEHGRRESPAPMKFGRWFEVMLGKSSGEISSTEQADAFRKFYQQVGITQRCFFTTSTGKMGLGPFDTLPGDLVTTLYGGQFCYILREVDEYYVLVGDSYLQGAMYGELQSPESNPSIESLKERNFVLR